MFGYATTSTPELMPAPIIFSHKLLQMFTTLRKNGEIPYLRPDSKAQVSVLHDDGVAKEITAVVVSHQTRDISIKKIRKDLEENARILLKDTGMVTNKTKFFINPTGRFVIGGPCGDSGVTGRKIIVDSYGGVGSHGGGAFSGKDPSKVDRSAAYYGRYVAKNIVAAGLAEKCEIQVAYAIGVAKPLSINVSTYGTGKIDETKIEKILMSGEVFDFRPGMLIKDLGLTSPKGWTYRKTSNYGHFGREGFPWEKVNRVAALRAAAGMKK
jgi:S-adenosylmethionine synthetase